jgi:hypothetical protein
MTYYDIVIWEVKLFRLSPPAIIMMIFSHLNFIVSISKLLLFGDNYDDFFTPQLHIFYEQIVPLVCGSWVTSPKREECGVGGRMGISRLLARVYAYMADEALFFVFFKNSDPPPTWGFFWNLLLTPTS